MPNDETEPKRDPYLDVIRATTEALVELSACVRALEKSTDTQKSDVTRSLEGVEHEMRVVGGAIRDYASAQSRIAEAEERAAEVAEDRREEERTAELARNRLSTVRWSALATGVRTVMGSPYFAVPFGALCLAVVQYVSRLLGVDLDVGGLVP